MGISRGTYYNHISDRYLSLETLFEYGKAIGFDFSKILPEIKQYRVEEPEVTFKVPQTLEEAIEQRDMWREKYYQLMEKYHRLLDQQQSGE